jgi:nucleoside-diphosphate-sugar epimerase
MDRLVQGQDYLFNLAGQTSHLDSMTDPFTDLEINAKAQLSILEACRKNNPNIKIIFASTRQIYGKPEYLPVDEKHPIRPVDVNGINKISGEQYHMLYNNVYGIRTCSLRLTNTYGPRMRIKDTRQTFVGVWIRNAVQGVPFEVWGGEQLRDFTFIDDCVEAMILAATKDISNGKCYNLGGVEVLSLKELADILSSISGVNYEIKKFPADRKKIDIGDYYANFDLIKSELGWKPTINAREGLANSIVYFSTDFDKYL